MDDSTSPTVTQQSPTPSQVPANSTVVVDQDGPDTTTVTTIPSNQIGHLAEVVSKTGPDPVMLASVIVFGAMMLTLVVYLIRRFQDQQEKMINHQQERSEVDQSRFQEQLNRQRDEFRTELGTQRTVHVEELTKTTATFERSLERIVVANKEGMDNLSQRLGVIDNRLMYVEDALVSKGHRRRRNDPPRAELKTSVSVTQSVEKVEPIHITEPNTPQTSPTVDINFDAVPAGTGGVNDL